MDQERAKLFEMELNGEKIPEDYKYEPKVKDHHEEPQDGQDQEESHSDKVNSQEDNSEDHYDDPKEANRPHYKKEGFKNFDEAKALKEKAGQEFAKKNWENALQLYKESSEKCPHSESDFLCKLYSNIAICFLKQVRSS